MTEAADAAEHLFDELKRYVGFGPEDEARLHALQPRVLPHIEELTHDFYEHILRHPAAQRAITGGDAQVERLKRTLAAWLGDLFGGPWDEAYYERRARIGRRHVEIRLPQQYMFTAVSVMRGHIVRIVLETSAGQAQAAAEILAVDRMLDMELAIMLHTYRQDWLAQMQRGERLATFGQLVASIGHELRNPLGVIESSLFLLRSRVGTDEKVVKHLDRIAGQIQASNHIITNLLDLVRDKPASPSPVPVVELVTVALESVDVPEGVTVTVTVPPQLRANVDPAQIRQVLVNLVGNAVDAVGDRGVILVEGRVDVGDSIVIAVSDSGTGIAPTVRARLFEPLVTSKSRGIGLGLALCKRLVIANGGTIELGDGPLSGATFEVRLPRAIE